MKKIGLLKVQLYIMSLGILFVLLGILCFHIPGSFRDILSVEKFIKPNILTFIWFGCFLITMFLLLHFKYMIRGSVKAPCKIVRCDNENIEYLGFLSTYIVPLICFDLSDIRQIIVLVLLLIIMGVIFIKMDFYLSNPILLFMGFHLYRVKVEWEDGSRTVAVISKDKLEPGNSIAWKEFDENAWFVRKVSK